MCKILHSAKRLTAFQNEKIAVPKNAEEIILQVLSRWNEHMHSVNVTRNIQIFASAVQTFSRKHFWNQR